MAPDEARAAVLQWLNQHTSTFGFRDDSDPFELVDVYSGKILTWRWSTIAEIQTRDNAVDGSTYIILMREDGQQFVLSPQGLAFPPDFTHTGPLPLPTPVLSMRDYNYMLDLVRQGDESKKNETVGLIMVLISLLDGAKKLGLEVGREEQEVDRELKRVEGW